MLRHISYVLAILLALVPAAHAGGPNPPPFNGGTVTNPITAPSVNVTGTAGYQITLGGTTYTGLNYTSSGTLIMPTASWGTLTGYSGNTFLGAEQNSASFTGTESVFIGDRTGGHTAAGNFIVAVGHDTLGIGSACTGITVNNDATTAVGTDVLRNGCGIEGVTAIGQKVLENYTGNNNSGHTGLGITAVGLNSMVNWNGGDYPWDTSIGTSSCVGATGATFTNGTCIGTNTGLKLTTASDFVILAGGGNGVVGSTTFASGHGVILIGSGAQTVDTPAPGTTNYINIENSLIESSTAPTISSGFGTSPSVSAGASSAAFSVNVGTGGTASSGVIAFATAAPHGWACSVVDETNYATANTIAVPTSTTTVTLVNYSRTSGSATAWAASDVLVVGPCNGY